MPYAIVYMPDAREHVRGLTARDRATLADAVDEQLRYQPNVETRNRKPMRPNPIAPWELRIGPLRVYYEVDEPAGEVVILGIGVKRGNRVWIGNEETEI